MSVLFDNVKVGDTVHYSTPQGQTGKGKVVIHKGTHLVLDAGGRHGRPQVVTDKNYIKHSREGKVVGALLSRLTSEAKLSPAEAKRKAIKRAARNYADARRTAAVNRQSPYKLGEPQMNAAKAFGWVKEGVNPVSSFLRKVKQRGIGHAISPKHTAFNRVVDMADAEHDHKNQDLTKLSDKIKSAKRYNRLVGVARNIHSQGKAKFGPVGEATWQGAEDPYNWDPVMRKQVFDAAAKVVRAKQKQKGMPVPHELDKGRTLKSAPAPYRRGMKEDSKDAEGAAERVAKTKKHKKKLHELDNSTLASYVSKSLEDRKKAKSGFDMAGRIHTGERKKYFQDKMFKRIDKRTVGIQKAISKIAHKLPAEPVGHPEPLKRHSDSEGARHGGWSGMHETAAPGKEAWIKANKQRFIDRYGKEKGLRVLYAKAWKDVKEARENEWAANQALAGQTRKKATGHYLVRDGRTLSGPHKPEEAVKAYRDMSDSKGVKIVHVKETHEFDVTRELISEAKVKEAAKKAINLKKKANGNKHVETEPKLDLPDRVNTTTLSADEGQDNAKV